MASPVLGDVAEHAVLDLVPLARTRGEVTDVNREAQVVGQALELELPEADSRSVAAAAVRGDHDVGRFRVRGLTHSKPPSAYRSDGELRRIVRNADSNPSFISADVVHPVGNCLPELLVGEVMHLHLNRLTLPLPLTACVLEVADELLLLGVDRDDRTTLLQEGCRGTVDEIELPVAVGVVCPLAALAVGLHAVAQHVEKPPDRRLRYRVPSLLKFPGQFGRALGRPSKRGHRIPTSRWIEEGIQIGEQRRIRFRCPLPTSSGPTDPALPGTPRRLLHTGWRSQLTHACMDRRPRYARGLRNPSDASAAQRHRVGCQTQPK